MSDCLHQFSRKVHVPQWICNHCHKRGDDINIEIAKEIRLKLQKAEEGLKKINKEGTSRNRSGDKELSCEALVAEEYLAALRGSVSVGDYIPKGVHTVTLEQAVIDAAIEWHQSKNPGLDGIMEPEEMELEDAVEALLTARR